MAGNHLDGLTLDDIQKEQDCIDNLIDKLLNTNTTSFIAELSSDSNSAPPRTPVQAISTRRGKGRAPKVTTVSTSSPVSRVSNGKQSLDSIIECLAKLNSQNKTLLKTVESLSDKIRNIECPRETVSSHNENLVSDELSNRLEKIEQDLNSNVLLCRGTSVPDLINQAKVGSSINHEGLKGTLCRAICGNEVTEIDIKNLQVSIVGRERKTIRIDCANSSSKIHIVRQARRKRPTGIYVNEFLSKTKLPVLNNLRNLKRLHPQKIKSVYTRDGNIFYRLQGAERSVLVRSNADISCIIPNSESSSLVEAPRPRTGTPVDVGQSDSIAGGAGPSVPSVEAVIISPVETSDQEGPSGR